MGAGCTSMAGRTYFPFITQDSSCVRWKSLQDLRVLYDSLWDKLDRCGHTPSWPKYGADPGFHRHQEEVDDLPFIEGFFRVEVSLTGSAEDGFECSPLETVFILTGGTLLRKIDRPDKWSYLISQGAKKQFNAIMNDVCKNCSKFEPLNQSSANESVVCPGGVSNPYLGFIKLTFGPADNGCGNIFDWGTNKEQLEDHIYNFDCYKVLDGISSSDCIEVKESCCSGEDVLFDIGRYEATGETDSFGFPILVLKFVDIFVTEGGDSKMTGRLAPLIYADELQEIKTRFISDIDKFGISDFYYCDEACGPTESVDCEGLAFVCGDRFTQSSIFESSAVTGGSCDVCGEIFEDIICACPWSELGNAMDFVNRQGCVIGCLSSSRCSCEDSEIYLGCTDPSACNYNAAANMDDGSCLFCEGRLSPCSSPTDPMQFCAPGCPNRVCGCTDDYACNYDPDANVDDESCDYCFNPDFPICDPFTSACRALHA